MNAEMRAKYETAAPFNHTVKIVRTGSVLKLDYELVGTDGNKYDLWKIRDQNKPTFSIYQDNIKIATVHSNSAILFVFVIAGLTCPKPYNTARFIITIGIVLFSILLIIFSMIMFVFYPAPEMPMNRRIVELLMASFFSGLIYYAGLLPFLILLLSNSFWRKRFEAVMGIRTQIPIEPSLPYQTP